MGELGLEGILGAASLGVVGLLAIYGAMHAFVKGLGAIIPGRDKVEIFGETLDAKVDPIILEIRKGVDLLNPKTNGGAGKGPDEGS